MNKLKALQEQRNKLAQEIRAMADTLSGDKLDFTSEEMPNWDKLNGDINALEKRIEIEARAVKVAEEAAAVAPETRAVGREDVTPNEVRAASGVGLPTAEDHAYALQGYILESRGDALTDRHRAAMTRCKIRGGQPDVELSPMNTAQVKRLQDEYRGYDGQRREYRAQSAVNAATGGTLIDPGSIASTVEAAMLYYGPMLAVGETIRTNTGEPFVWPTFNDTSNSGRQLGENTAVTVTNLTTASVSWSAYKFSSDELLVPYELLQDSPFNLAAIIGEALGERLGRIMNTKFTTGTGASTPYGIVTQAASGVTAASATAIAADELITLAHAVDIAYRNMPGAAYMMHDLILSAIRKLKDGNGQYLWTNGMQAGAPSTLWGYPIKVNNDMQSTIATGTTTVIFGDMSKYKIRQVGGPRFYRLQERNRDTDQDAFIAFVRADGNLLNAGGNPVKKLVQA